MHKCNIWKSHNQTLPPEVLPMEGQQKKKYINITGKRLGGGKDKEIFEEV